MEMKRSTLVLFATAIIACVAAQGVKAKRWEPTADWFQEARIYERPKAGYVGSKETAISIGRAVIQGAYGKVFAKGSEPLNAKLFGDVWVVYSYFPMEDPIPVGGVTTVEISKTSGSILSLRSER